MIADPQELDTGVERRAAEASRRPLHAAVDQELRAIFAEAPATAARREAAVESVSARVRPPPLLGWLGAVVGLSLVAVAVATLAAPESKPADPPVAAPMTAPSSDLSPGLVPDPAPQQRAAPPRSAPPRSAQTASRILATPQSAQRAQRATAGGCEGARGDVRARCLYPAVMRADRQLRDAYDRATRNGVPRSVMVSYRDRWSDMRRDARRDPDRVIAAYRRMATELDARGSR